MNGWILITEDDRTTPPSNKRNISCSFIISVVFRSFSKSKIRNYIKILDASKEEVGYKKEKRKRKQAHNKKCI